MNTNYPSAGSSSQNTIMDKMVKYVSERIKSLGGKNPIVFLDAGAVIDFEKWIKQAKLKNSSLTPDHFYGALNSQGFSVFLTEHALEEVETHHIDHKIGGRPEVGPRTMDISRKLHSNYMDFLKNAVPTLSIDNVRLDTFWASRLAFPEDHKKSEQDPMSYNDRELVASSVWSRYVDHAHAPTGVVILSPDAHVIETTRILTDSRYDVSDKFGYGGVSVLSTR
ncbi:MAG: hypothetical protein WCK90_00760 [archaeon]